MKKDEFIQYLDTLDITESYRKKAKDVLAKIDFEVDLETQNTILELLKDGEELKENKIAGEKAAKDLVDSFNKMTQTLIGINKKLNEVKESLLVANALINQKERIES